MYVQPHNNRRTYRYVKKNIFDFLSIRRSSPKMSLHCIAHVWNLVFYGNVTVYNVMLSFNPNEYCRRHYYHRRRASMCFLLCFPFLCARGNCVSESITAGGRDETRIISGRVAYCTLGSEVSIPCIHNEGEGLIWTLCRGNVNWTCSQSPRFSLPSSHLMLIEPLTLSSSQTMCDCNNATTMVILLLHAPSSKYIRHLCIPTTALLLLHVVSLTLTLLKLDNLHLPSGFLPGSTLAFLCK